MIGRIATAAAATAAGLVVSALTWAPAASAAQITRFSPEGVNPQVRQVAIRFDEFGLKLPWMRLGLLQAQHVGLFGRQPGKKPLLGDGADSVDIPAKQSHLQLVGFLDVGVLDLGMGRAVEEEGTTGA
jgi:hypothetical protein